MAFLHLHPLHTVVARCTMKILLYKMKLQVNSYQIQTTINLCYTLNLFIGKSSLSIRTPNNWFGFIDTILTIPSSDPVNMVLSSTLNKESTDSG